MTRNPWRPVSNWKQSDLPFGRKVRALLRNNWIKLRHRRACCGNLEEPGCCRGHAPATAPAPEHDAH